MVVAKYWKTSKIIVKEGEKQYSFTPINAAAGRIRRKRVKNFAEEFFDTAKP